MKSNISYYSKYFAFLFVEGENEGNLLIKVLTAINTYEISCTCNLH